MKIVSAQFLLSAPAPALIPPPSLPEIAFIGKSNVGKSSLINALLNRKGLVKTSGTPGKTRALNFFLINERFQFVDLPGYGFAKVHKSEQESWRVLSEDYLQHRDTLKGVVLIVDLRHPGSPLDSEMKAWLDHFELPTVIVANKADKLPKSKVARHLAKWAEALGLEEPPLAYSAKTHLGREKLWRQLDAWLPGRKAR